MRKAACIVMLSALVIVWSGVDAEAVDIKINDTGSFSHPYSDLPADRRWVLTSTDLGGFNSSGSDKVVLCVCGEKIGTSYDEISYAGVAMTQVVAVAVVDGAERNAQIFYLDNPGSGDLVIDLKAGNGVGLSVIALSNTGEGYVSPPSSSLTTSTSITTTNDNAIVVAAAVNNSSGCPPQSPLIEIYSGDAGSSGHGSGYQKVASAGTTITPTFPTALAVIAAEFPPAPPAGMVLVIR